MIDSSAKVIAGCFALSAFAVAIISGVLIGNSAAQVLVRALVAMFVCYPVGMIVGMVCARVVQGHVEKHVRSNPVSGATGGGHSAEPAAKEPKSSGASTDSKSARAA